MVAYTFYEGDNRVMRYTEALAARGDQVDVIALRKPGQSKIDRLPGVTVYRIQERTKDEKRMLSYVVRILMFFLRATWAITWKHLRKPYDLVHVHSVPDFLAFVPFLPRITGSAVILDIHDLLPEFYGAKFGGGAQSFKFKLLCFEEKASARFAHHVIAPNHIWQERLIGRSVPASRCSVVMNFPDPAVFHRHGRTRNDGRFLMCYPGSLNKHQGLHVAIRAFALIADKIPAAEFHIYGEGPAKPALGELAQELGLGERVQLHASLSLREIARVIENMDLGVVPKSKDSFGNEAFSTKTLEFMTLGVPLVVSDTKVDRYYFNDDVVTFFRGGEVDDLAAAMLRLATRPELREKQVRQAEAFVAEYSWDARKGEYFALVDRLTARRRKGEKPHPAQPAFSPTRAAEGGQESAALVDRYRLCASDVRFTTTGDVLGQPGFFRFGPKAIGYGTLAGGKTSPRADGALHDAALDAVVEPGSVRLPFDLDAAVENLRRERYSSGSNGGTSPLRRMLRSFYYFFRPITPAPVRKLVKRLDLRGWRRASFPEWPVDTNVEFLLETALSAVVDARGGEPVPFIWFWPEGAEGCVCMTHDVEEQAGRDGCEQLMELDSRYGIRASFQIVPEERYEVPADLLRRIRNAGFEIVIQDLNHDGTLFRDRQEFERRARKINAYAREFGATGFRAAVLYRNPDWYDALECSYDMSVPNVAHLDPQRGGCCTVMPYFIGNKVEIPLTTTQDYMLFHLLKDYSINLWKQQTKAILDVNGLVVYLVHPDYLRDTEEHKAYVQLLEYLSQLRSGRNLWFALPGEIDGWWRARSQMRLVERDGGWVIEGPQAERARVAFARRGDGGLKFSLESSHKAGAVQPA